MSAPGEHRLRIGVDLGGTKIEGVLLAPNIADAHQSEKRMRLPTPRGDYHATIKTIAELVERLAPKDMRATIGIGVPGSISPATGVIQNANSTWLNGRPLDADLTAALSRPVRIANDANCFALSEAVDGAGQGAHSVLGVILGTGAGSGFVLGGQIINGPRGIGGEWGHNPLPAPCDDERPGPRCWCGRLSCIETWVSGPAIARDHERTTGRHLSAMEICSQATKGDPAALATLARHVDRLARGLAHVVNIVDPEIIVLGGGLSKMEHLYRQLPAAMAPHIFADRAHIEIRPPKWGDASGVRGAAWLWDEIGNL